MNTVQAYQTLYELLQPIHEQCKLLRLGHSQSVDCGSLSALFDQSIAKLSGELSWGDPEKRLVTVTTALKELVVNNVDISELQRYYDLFVVFDALVGEIFAAIEMDAMNTGAQKTRIELIQELIQKFGYTQYLEIGTRHDDCFNAIDVTTKTGVDPGCGGTHRMTSDEYFEKHDERFDIIFIDGLHEATQVVRDIENSLQVLKEGGTIVMHDCNPLFESRQMVPPIVKSWNGDPWRAFVHFRARSNVDMIVTNFDQGCGVLRGRKNQKPIVLNKSYESLDWSDLEANRSSWLNVHDWVRTLKWV